MRNRRGMGLRRVVGVRHGAGPAAVSRDPLPQTGGAQRQVPLVAEQGFEEAVVPRRGGGCPRALEPAGDRRPRPCRCRSCSASPAPAPRGRRPRVPGRGDVAGSAAPWVLPNVCPPAISATVSSSFIPIRRNVSRMSRAEVTRVRDGVRALRVDVDEAHLVGGQRVVQLPDAAVPLVAEPGAFGTPVDVLVGLPDVHPAAGEAEGREAHRLPGHGCPRRPSGRPRRSCGRTSSSPATAAGAPCRGCGCPASCSAARSAAMPAAGPPRPSSMRYVPAQCHTIRTTSGP